MTTLENKSSIQMTGLDLNGRYILSVISKRTYRIHKDGSQALAETQDPLVVEPLFYDDIPTLLRADVDIFPFKPKTDVVLKGFAWNPGFASTFDVSLRVAGIEKRIRVIGDRHCTLSADGRVLFSAPKPIEKIPCRYDYAYGGEDRAYEDRYGNPTELLRPYMDDPSVLEICPYHYPRNLWGRGFLMAPFREAVEELRLPNLEDPIDLLTPDRIVVGSMGRWPLMPIPQSFDWVDYGSFPRAARFGVVHPHDPVSGVIAEVVRGFCPPDILDRQPFEDRADFEAINGASLGLQVEYLQGGEEIILENIHPAKTLFKVRVPTEHPKMWTDARNGKLNETNPVIHTVFLDLEDISNAKLCVVWRGSAPALRPYQPEELEKMPFLVEWPDE